MPFDFFNTRVPRGAIFRAKQNEFVISDETKPFSSINARLSQDFVTFSAPRLFTPLLDNTLLMYFRIPGKYTPAGVSGIGAVFVDVDLKFKTYLYAYDKANCLIAKVAVPEYKNGLSFVGVKVLGVKTWSGVKAVKAPIWKVKYVLGTKSIQKKYWTQGDAVVLDDLIYGEPNLYSSY